MTQAGCITWANPAWQPNLIDDGAERARQARGELALGVHLQLAQGDARGPGAAAAATLRRCAGRSRRAGRRRRPCAWGRAGWPSPAWGSAG